MLRNVLRCTIKSVQSRTRQNVMFLPLINQNLILKCEYARWSHRRPSKIVNEDELYDSDDSERKPSQIRTLRKQQLAQKETFVNSQAGPETVTDTNEDDETLENTEEVDVQKSYSAQITKKRRSPPYTLISNHDDYAISKIMLEVKGRKRQKENQKIILEGNILIKDALDANVTLETVLFSRLNDVQALNLPDDVNLYKVPYRTIRTWSNLSTSPGVLAIARVPDIEETEPPNDALPLTIICDNIREPGNLGTILRTAAGVGCEKLILLKGCVDLWDSKVLRSAAGAHFRTQIYAYKTWDDIISMISNDTDIFIADSNTLTSNNGNEAENVTTDMTNDDDLEEDNRDINSSDSSDDDEDNKLATANITDGLMEDLSLNFQDSYFAESRKGKLIIDKFMSRLPVVPYYDIDYTMNETVLIISGETAGVSFQTYNALRQRNGMRINIPLSEKIDSLNTSMALAVIAFEIKRQFLIKQKLESLDTVK